VRKLPGWGGSWPHVRLIGIRLALPSLPAGLV